MAISSEVFSNIDNELLRIESEIDVTQIYSFLNKVDRDFPIHLSSKVDLKEYAEKLKCHATICAVIENNVVSSLVAGYVENTTGRMAYISIVASSLECRGKGYAKFLLEKFVDICKQMHLKGIHLYAVPSNVRAMNLYKKIGFVEWQVEDEERPNDAHLVYYLN